MEPYSTEGSRPAQEKCCFCLSLKIGALIVAILEIFEGLTGFCATVFSLHFLSGNLTYSAESEQLSDQQEQPTTLDDLDLEPKMHEIVVIEEHPVYRTTTLIIALPLHVTLAVFSCYLIFAIFKRRKSFLAFFTLYRSITVIYFLIIMTVDCIIYDTSARTLIYSYALASIIYGGMLTVIARYYAELKTAENYAFGETENPAGSFNTGSTLNLV